MDYLHLQLFWMEVYCPLIVNLVAKLLLLRKDYEEYEMIMSFLCSTLYSFDRLSMNGWKTEELMRQKLFNNLPDGHFK